MSTLHHTLPPPRVHRAQHPRRHPDPCHPGQLRQSQARTDTRRPFSGPHRPWQNHRRRKKRAPALESIHWAREDPRRRKSFKTASQDRAIFRAPCLSCDAEVAHPPPCRRARIGSRLGLHAGVRRIVRPRTSRRCPTPSQVPVPCRTATPRDAAPSHGIWFCAPDPEARSVPGWRVHGTAPTPPPASARLSRADR